MSFVYATLLWSDPSAVVRRALARVQSLISPAERARCLFVNPQIKRQPVAFLNFLYSIHVNASIKAIVHLAKRWSVSCAS